MWSTKGTKSIQLLIEVDERSYLFCLLYNIVSPLVMPQVWTLTTPSVKVKDQQLQVGLLDHEGKLLQQYENWHQSVNDNLPTSWHH